MNEPVSVWMSADGRPERVVWRSRRYVVTDTPTPLVAMPDPVLEFVTHPPDRWVTGAGWRFQGTSENGATHVFDISPDEHHGQWRVVRTYD